MEGGIKKEDIKKAGRGIGGTYVGGKLKRCIGS